MATQKVNSARCTGYRFTVGPKRGDGGPMVISEWAAPWTEANRKAGGWEEVPETVSGNVALLPSERACKSIDMKPGGGLEKNQFQLDASTVDGFHLFIPTKEGQARELRFTVASSAVNAYSILGKYLHVCGEAKGALRIKLSDDDQGELDDKDDGQGELKEE